MTVVAEALEALGHQHGALPEPRLLADLFVRFQAQVPLRPAPAGSEAATLLAAWLEELGFGVRPVLSAVRGMGHGAWAWGVGRGAWGVRSAVSCQLLDQRRQHAMKS